MTTAEDYSKDYATKRLCDEAAEALDALLEGGKLPPKDEAACTELAERLQQRSDHIVQVWD